jgi:hypothetical protein
MDLENGPPSKTLRLTAAKRKIKDFPKIRVLGISFILITLDNT